MRRVALSILSATFLFLAAGCGENVSIQDRFKGLWALESRSLPEGQTVQSPKISGWFEWFVIDQNRGHATFALSSGEDHIQFVAAVYTISGATFTRDIYLQIGGGYGPASRSGYDTRPKSDRGRIDFDGNRAVMAHADGTTLTFEGDKLTIAHRDGTVDTWKKAG